MILDIVHVLLGLVPGSLISTSMQIISRLYVAWVILYPHFMRNVCHPIMLVSWSLAEIIRYTYYNAQKNKILTFLRYSAFIVLYPSGVLLGEVPLIYGHSRLAADVGWSGAWIDRLVLIAYIPGFPYLFWHMIKLRKKKLGGPRKDE
jgi:very-long-chain (3R)-3-hydroxyacyl-CoA dehydratase